MQQLGRGIAAVGDAFGAFAEQEDKEAEFDDKLKVAKALNNADAELNQLRETYQGDGNDFESRSQDIYKKHMDPLTGELRSKRMQQSYPLLYEQQRGARYERAQGYGSTMRTQTRVIATQNLLETQIGALDWSSPEAAEQSMATVASLSQRMIDEIPGLTPAQREAQYKNVRTMFDQSINNLMAKGKIPAGVVGPTLERIRERLSSMVETEPVAPTSAISGSANEIAAQKIVQSEARRDKQGRLVVYSLPARDGGGSYEVAGINERYHPQKAAELAALIRAGKHDEAEKQARDYIIKYTDGAARNFDDAGIQYLVRDIAFNRGPGGANAAIRMAIGDRPGSKTTAHRNLTADELSRAQEMASNEPQKFAAALTQARADYEYRFVGKRDEFDAGLRNRWAQGQKTAMGLIGYGRGADKTALVGPVTPGQQEDTPEAGAPREANAIPGEVKVADAGGQTAGSVTLSDAPAPAGRVPAPVPGTRLKNSVALEMLRHLDEKSATWIDMDKKRVGGAIKSARDKVLDGYPLDEPTQAALTAAVANTKDPALAAELGALTSIREQVKFVQTAPMVQTQALIAQYQREFQTRTPTDVEKKAFETLQDIALKKSTKLLTDSLSWARATGVVPPGIDITTQMGNPDALDARLAEATRVGQQFGVPMQYFTETERKTIAEMIEKGADPLAFAAPIVERWGPMHATQAMRELSDKMPVAALAGHLLTINPPVAMEISTELKNRQAPDYKPLEPDKIMLKSAQDSLGDAFAQFPKQQQDMLMAGAVAVWRTRAHKTGQATEDMLKQALRDVLGERKDSNGNIYGGLAPAGRHKTGAGLGTREHMIMLPHQWKREATGFQLLPTTGDAEDWRTVLQKVTPADLVAAGIAPPVDRQGNPISMARLLSSGTLSHARDGNANGRFEVAQGKLGSDKEDWVMAGEWVADETAGTPAVARGVKPKGLFVLDLNALYPILKRRYPGAFHPGD
jgi:hypothetical protein